MPLRQRAWTVGIQATGCVRRLPLLRDTARSRFITRV